ncbi:classical arabinogalactan protein 26-like [Sesbania bispinosa]|nr:classical arabinogalactan protein 26-like [Sesbania bispinosa]
MASFNVHLALMIIISFMPSPLLSSYSSPPIPKVPTLSSSPASLTEPPPSTLSPFQELSPDIAPLLPSPGGALPTPAGSDIPTIPSNPSPPNPDDMIAPGPLSALSPFGSMQATSNAPRSLVCDLATTAFAGLAAYWFMQYMRV